MSRIRPKNPGYWFRVGTHQQPPNRTGPTAELRTFSKGRSRPLGVVGWRGAWGVPLQTSRLPLG